MVVGALVMAGATVGGARPVAVVARRRAYRLLRERGL